MSSHVSEQASSTSPASAGPILSVRNVSKRFGGVLALNNVSIDLFPGEVHCLAGENGCGKSTLIKVISGAERPDDGVIEVDGIVHHRMNTTSAIESGIQVIYQDFSLFPNLSVAENIVLTSAVADKHKIYRSRPATEKARAIVEELQLSLDLDAEVGELSVADRQLTAICRALVSDARVIIMDEPTTALTHTEVDQLFTVVERLRVRGVALAFVSHKLNEVLAISQRLTIMRSGQVVITGPSTDFDRRSVTRHMTGSDVKESRRVSTLDPDAVPRLQVSELTLHGAFRDVSFTVGKGEIVGITGLLGSGRTELAEAIFGVHPAKSGQIKIDGIPTAIRSIQDAVAAGIGYVPEDRLTQGLFLEKSIADNIIAGSLDPHRTWWRVLDRKRIKATIDRLFTQLKIHAPNPGAAVRTLSGGNAQRVVLAKWLATNPKVLLLNGPTVGVDVGSKAQILDLLRAQAALGMGVVVISDDAPELVACCHRVLVVARGRLVNELTGEKVWVEAIQEKAWLPEMEILRKLRGRNNEGSLALVLLFVIIVMSVLNPVFFSVNTAFSIFRSATVPLILALAVLMVIVSGGIDVSFAAVAIFSAYTAVTLCLKLKLDLGMPAIFGLAIAIGGVLGLINGFVIARFRLPTLIVTLGTQGIFFGVMLTYVGTRYYPDLPASMAALSTVNVVDITTSNGRAYLHVLVLLAIALAAIVWAMLKFTMFGRSLYAIGGDFEGARRAGFRVMRTQLMIYVIVGMVAAAGGVAHIVMSRSANPQDLVGGELDIIAAVVLGGASIFGGRGSVLGTVLGVLLIQVINNSLLLVGVPSAWLRAAVGILLILGVGIQAITARRKSERIHTVDDSVEAAVPTLEKVS